MTYLGIATTQVQPIWPARLLPMRPIPGHPARENALVLASAASSLCSPRLGLANGGNGVGRSAIKLYF